MNPLLSQSCQTVCAIAVMFACFSCGAFAQRGGGFRGGFSGSRGGFSAPHAGFSGARPGFSAPAGGFHSAPPAFRSGFFGPRPGFRPVSPRSMAPAGFAPRSPSYPVGGMRPVTTGQRMPYGTSTLHRAPYLSPIGFNHFVHHDGFHHHHNHVFFVPHNHVFVNSFWPFWGWGYPYTYGYPYQWPSIFNDSGNYDSRPALNYTAPQPSDYYNVPYQPQPEGQQEPAPPDPSPQQPTTSHRAPHGGAPSSAPSAPPVTLVFKDGRSPEQIHNYLLTQNTLTVLDRLHRDIPVSEIDVDATVEANLQAGVEFSIPSP